MRGEHPGVVPGAGGQHRRRRAARPAGRAARRRSATTGVADSAVTVDRRTVAARPARRPAAYRRRPARSSVSGSAARASSQPVTCDGIALVALGSTATRPTVACAPRSRASLLAASTVYAKVSIGSRRSAIRVVPAWLASPVKSKPPPAVRPDRAGHRRPARPGRPARGPARRAARRRRRSGPAAPGRAPGRPVAERLGEASPRPRRAAPAARSGVERPGEQPRPQARHAEPGALLLDERRRPPIGRAGVTPARAQLVDGEERATMPSGPSYAPPCGTESKWLPVSTASAAVRVTPPGQQVAVAVLGRPACPRRSACARNQSRSASSGSVSAYRR